MCSRPQINWPPLYDQTNSRPSYCNLGILCNKSYNEIQSNLKYICPSTVPYWFSFKYFLIPFCHRASSIAWINILLIAPPFEYAIVSNWAVTSSGVSTTKPSLFCLFINGLEFVFASARSAYGSHQKAFQDFRIYFQVLICGIWYAAFYMVYSCKVLTWFSQTTSGSAHRKLR